MESVSFLQLNLSYFVEESRGNATIHAEASFLCVEAQVFGDKIKWTICIPSQLNSTCGGTMRGTFRDEFDTQTLNLEAIVSIKF
jgi:hypothetical protein